MRVVFVANLVYEGQARTGVFASKKADMNVLPVANMDIEDKGFHAPRTVMDVTLSIDSEKYDVYVNLTDIGCPTEEDMQLAIEKLQQNGWKIHGQK